MKNPTTLVCENNKFKGILEKSEWVTYNFCLYFITHEGTWEKLGK